MARAEGAGDQVLGLRQETAQEGEGATAWGGAKGGRRVAKMLGFVVSRHPVSSHVHTRAPAYTHQIPAHTQTRHTGRHTLSTHTPSLSDQVAVSLESEDWKVVLFSLFQFPPSSRPH